MPQLYCCPNCRKSVEAEVWLPEQLIQCPGCNKSFYVRTTPAGPPPIHAAPTPVSVLPAMSGQTPTLRLGRVIGSHVVWFVVFSFLPDLAVGVGLSENSRVRGDLWYLGHDSTQIKTIYSIGWLIVMGVYCFSWYWSPLKLQAALKLRSALHLQAALKLRSTLKLQAALASSFSLGQQAIQKGIVAGCRGFVLSFAILYFFACLDVFDSVRAAYHPGVEGGSIWVASSEGAFLVGLIVAIIAALVRYATIETKTGRS